MSFSLVQTVVVQTAKTRRTSLYMVNSSKRTIPTRPPPRPRTPSPYFSSVPHVSSPCLLCNSHEYLGRMTLFHVSRLRS